MELLSKVHARNLVGWAKDRPRVIVFSADLTSSTEVDLFKRAYPQRFFSMGMTEQNMVSFAGGMAREGYFPYLHTFAVFFYRRAYDQIACSVAYPNLPVRFIGFLPGVLTPGGATHQAIEDISVLRALPNMTILEVCDVTEVETVLDAAQEVPGPVYVRMLRGEIPRVFDPSQPFRIGEARTISQGGDVALFTSGICTTEALRAAHALRERGVSVYHVHISTHKPFNSQVVCEVAAQVKLGVITLENHTVIGGLGSSVAEALAAGGIGKRLVRLGIQDTFMHGASRDYLMREYGLDAMALVAAVEKLVQQPLHISADDLSQTLQTPSASDANAERL